MNGVHLIVVEQRNNHIVLWYKTNSMIDPQHQMRDSLLMIDHLNKEVLLNCHMKVMHHLYLPRKNKVCFVVYSMTVLKTRNENFNV